jgi:hypothetical protein
MKKFLVILILTVASSVFSNEEPKPKYDRLFPLLTAYMDDETIKKLPLPFGVTFNGTYIDQDFEISKIAVMESIPDEFKNLELNMKGIDKNYNVKLDAWLFPFFNVFTILGYTSGYKAMDSASKTRLIDAANDLASSPSIPPSFASLAASIPTTIGALGSFDYTGFTYGIGAVGVWGYRDFFISVPFSYVRTNVDLKADIELDSTITAYVLQPRLGYSWKVNKNLSLAPMLGAMYQHVKQTVSGSIGFVGFSAEEKASYNWNMTLGLDATFYKNFTTMIELGFINKNCVLFKLGYRF